MNGHLEPEVQASIAKDVGWAPVNTATRLPPELSPTAQGILSGIQFGLSSVTGALAGGALLSLAGPRVLFRCCIALALRGAAVMGIGMRGAAARGAAAQAAAAAVAAEAAAAAGKATSAAGADAGEAGPWAGEEDDGAWAAAGAVRAKRGVGEEDAAAPRGGSE